MVFTERIGIGHVGLNVTNLGEATQFFVEALGFQIQSEGAYEESRFVFLGHGGNLTLTLWEQSTKGSAFSTASPGLHHLAFAVDDVTQLKEAQAHLKAQNVVFFYDGEIVAHREGGDYSAIYFAGPDGIRLEVYAPNGGEDLAVPVQGAPACGFF